jgi:phospholipid/cholesterol/gamma-HCH transport system ATP-binding protein
VKLSNELHITSLVVTHDLASAYKVGDRIVMLHDGKVLFDGTPDDVKSTSNAIVRQFIEGRAEGPIVVGSAE